MDKNFNLSWARKNAELTQQEVAAALGVDTDTVGRWERGVRRMPRKQWQSFIKLVGVDARGVAPYMPPQSDPSQRADCGAPRTRKYDSWGYPVGFDRRRCIDIAIDITLHRDKDGDAVYDDAFSSDLEEAALSEIEGVEHASRRQERYALMLARLGDRDTAPLPPLLPETLAACKDAIFCCEQWRLSGRKSRRQLDAARDAYHVWRRCEGM